nr:thiamine ABC transporter substrate-binding protein [Marinicella sp. W31]MDC2879521.1 thiamine ABC transporter substrate-binding protein [Marinicella sp. W31]
MPGYHLPISIAALAVLAAGGAQAEDSKVLTIYTYESFNTEWGPGPLVSQAFEAECDCTVKFVGAEDGVALLNRLKLEGQSSPADIVLGLDNNLIHEAKQTGLLSHPAFPPKISTFQAGLKTTCSCPSTTAISTSSMTARVFPHRRKRLMN